MAMETENTHNVPKAQWKKWTAAEQRMFNSLYDVMCANQSLFIHPKQTPPAADHWNTTAWNAAWMAADEMREQRKQKEGK